MQFQVDGKQYDSTDMITVETAPPFSRQFYITHDFTRVFTLSFFYETGVAISPLSLETVRREAERYNNDLLRRAAEQMSKRGD